MFIYPKAFDLRTYLGLSSPLEAGGDKGGSGGDTEDILSLEAPLPLNICLSSVSTLSVHSSPPLSPRKMNTLMPEKFSENHVMVQESF